MRSLVLGYIVMLYIVILVVVIGCGETGPAGPQGPAAEPYVQLDAESTEPVIAQFFCPSKKPKKHYREYSIMLSGKLYAVYADKGSVFMTQLTPGRYCTTDGRDCCFNVSDDLKVMYE